MKKVLTDRLVYFFLILILKEFMFVRELLAFANINYFSLALQASLIIVPILFSKVKGKLSKDQLILMLILLLLLVCSLLSAIINPLYTKDILNQIFIFIFPVMILFILVKSSDNVYQNMINVAKMIITVTVFLCVYGIFLYKFGSESIAYNSFALSYQFGPFLLHQNVVGGSGYRIASLTSNPNTLGWLIFISISCTILCKESYKKITFFILILVQLLTVFLTQSRASIVSVLIFFLIYTFVKSTDKLKTALIEIFTLIIVFILFAILSTRFNLSSFDRISVGLNTRDDIWKLLIDSIADKSMFGVGFGNSELALLSSMSRGAHNVYLSIMSEIGLFGFAIFIILLFFVISCCLKQIKKYGRITIFCVYFSLICSIMLHQFFEDQLLRYNFLSMYFFFMLLFITESSSDINTYLGKEES